MRSGMGTDIVIAIMCGATALVCFIAFVRLGGLK